VVISSVPEVASSSLIAGCGTAVSDDRCDHLLNDLSDTFCDMNTACSHTETLNSDLPAAEHSDIEQLKHITLDKTSDCTISHVASKKNDDKYSEFTLRLDAGEKDAETKASSTEQSIDKDRTSELL